MYLRTLHLCFASGNSTTLTSLKPRARLRTAFNPFARADVETGEMIVALVVLSEDAMDGMISSCSPLPVRRYNRIQQF